MALSACSIIRGTVNPYREAIIKILVLGPNGGEREIDCVVDTGFTGCLTLPGAAVADLELPFQRQGRAILADGSETTFDIFEASVVWEGEPLRVPIDLVEADPLVGMSLLYGSELVVQIIDGGFVTVRPLFEE